MGTPKQPETDARSYVPEAVAGTVAALPAANLALRGKSKHRFGGVGGVPMHDSPHGLEKYMRPGDVLLGGHASGSPGVADAYLSGTPLWHGEIVTDNTDFPRALYGGSQPSKLRSHALKDAPYATAQGYTDAVLLRPKTNVPERALRNSMSEIATRKYQLWPAALGVLQDAFVPPNPLSRRIGDVNCEGSYCTSGVAMGLEDTLKEPVTPHKHPSLANAGDLLRSDAFEPIAAYSKDDGFLRHMPSGELSRKTQYVARAGLGAAVAAPAYALMNNPLAAVAGAAAAPLALRYGRPLLKKHAPKTYSTAQKGVTKAHAKLPKPLQDLWALAKDPLTEDAAEVGANVKNRFGLTRAEVPEVAGAAYLGGTAAGVLAPSLWRSSDASAKTAAMHLHFDTPQDIQDHQRTRQRAGAVGALAMGAAGGLLGGKLKGVPGGLVGGLAGGALGNWLGKTTADVAHDVPQRTGHQLHSTVNTLDQAGGSGIRIASVLPSASDFAQLAQEFEEGDGGPPVDSDEQMLDKRLRSPHWGPTTPMEGGDATNLNVTMGVPAYGGV